MEEFARQYGTVVVPPPPSPKLNPENHSVLPENVQPLVQPLLDNHFSNLDDDEGHHETIRTLLRQKTRGQVLSTDKERRYKLIKKECDSVCGDLLPFRA